LPYAPTHPEFFQKVVGSLPVKLADYNFVDLGAGKGLALLLASKYPFKSITGVEYSKVLADLATGNIRSIKEQPGMDRSIECIWGDATNFELPNSPTVLYLFNPFQGKVMDRVIANIENSLRAAPRDLWVVYGIPWEGRKFRRSPMLETIEWNSDYSLHRSLCR
jgi:predicted RNA methylase